MGVHELPRYSAASAARLVGLGSWRVRRWLQGYNYKYTAGPFEEERIGHKGPIVNRPVEATAFASFIELIDLLFVREFIAHGLSLQKIRRALEEAERLLGDNHFAKRRFFTDGKRIYLQVKDKAEALVELLSGGQWVIAPIILELAKQVDFDRFTGLAQRWYPLGLKGHIVIDPEISFGKPVITGTGILTGNVFDLFEAEKEKTKRVCFWLGLKPAQVHAAVSFEKRLLAA